MQKQNFKSKKVLIFASGNGSNFEAIVKHFYNKGFRSVQFELLVDNKDSYAVKRAKNLNIPHFYVKFEDLYEFLKPREYDLYVLAGYMRILPEKILNLGTLSGSSTKKTGVSSQENKFINIHPSLLPEFKGKNAIKRAYDRGVKKTGVTVHFVEKNVDSGKIIAQKEISTEGKTLEALEKAIHEIEHKIYPEIVENLLFKKNVLLFGGGAREHAIALKLLESPFLNRLYLLNPNDGFKNLGKVIEYKKTENPAADYAALAKKARSLNIDLLVVGPENPLFDGITDIFQKEGIKVIGANKKWAALEGSKSFAKVFMAKNGIKTADYKVLDDKSQIKQALEYFKQAKDCIPPVIKADGAALGKGVSLPETFKEAEFEAENFLNGKFGKASKKIVVEERLFGKEISLLSLWDGKNLLSFPPACDYKRLLDNNKGSNTGGMGSYAPSKITEEEKKHLNTYLETLKTALIKENADFKGIIYSGLILAKNSVYVLEYNMRFGDPETQVLLELLDTSRGVDLLDIFIKMSEGRLCEADLKFARKEAYCLVLASSGYPENPKKGAVIKNLDSAENTGCKIFFAGVKSAGFSPEPGLQSNHKVKRETNSKYNYITNGGRVLNIVKSAPNGILALNDIYKTATSIDFDGKIYRKDIGKS